jgi:hypothetical protein
MMFILLSAAGYVSMVMRCHPYLLPSDIFRLKANIQLLMMTGTHIAGRNDL